MRYADVEQGEAVLLDGVRDFLDVGPHLADADLHGVFPER